MCKLTIIGISIIVEVHMRSTEYNSYSYTYCVLTMNQVLRSLHVRIYLIFITMQSMGRFYYYPHFTEEKTKNREPR